MQPSNSDILAYWRSYEYFLMPSVSLKKPVNRSKDKPIILSGKSDVPWPITRCHIDKREKESDYWFNLYIGIVSKNFINKKLQHFLAPNNEDYGLSSKKEFTCLAAVTLNSDGLNVSQNLMVPDYIYSIHALENYDKSKSFVENRSESISKINNVLDFYKLESDAFLNVDLIKSFASELTSQFETILVSDLTNVAVCHVKIHKEPLNPGTITTVSKADDDNDIVDDKNRQESLDIFPSFFIEGLTKLVQKGSDLQLNKGLERYLRSGAEIKKEDIYQSKTTLKNLLSPHKIPHVCWPMPKGRMLSFAQQLSVNTALSGQALFSVNGPPGTGKSTLLRDIFSEVIFLRARELVKFKHPLDAFGDSVHSSIPYHCHSYSLDKSLKNFGMVVAASNNNAVENISKELPSIEDINQDLYYANEDNDYFSEISNIILETNDSWAMVAAVLGNSSNVKSFFDKFWGNYNPVGMKKLLKEWNFSKQSYEKEIGATCTDNRAYEQWVRFNLEHLNAEYKKKWQLERKNFNTLCSKLDEIIAIFDKANQHFDGVENLQLKLLDISSDIDSDIQNINAIDRHLDDIDISLHDVTNKLNAQQTILIKHQEKSSQIEKLAVLYEKRDNHLANIDGINQQIKTYKDKFRDLSVEIDELNLEYEILSEKEDCIIESSPSMLMRKLFPFFKKVNKWKTAKQEIRRDKLQLKKNLHVKLKSKNDHERFIKENSHELAIESKALDSVSCEINPIEDLLGNFKLLDGAEIEQLKGRYEQRLKKIEDKLQLLSNKKVQTQSLLNEKKKTLSIAEDKRRSLQKRLDSEHLYIEKAKKYFESNLENFPDNLYWDKEFSELHISSPWLCGMLQTIRQELFFSAMRLHKYFIVLARSKISSNITTFKTLLDGKLAREHRPNIQSLWDSFFLLIPLISTTFSSSDKLLASLEKDALAYLLLDEAGQANPHHAASCIYRAKHTIVVGDPLQVEPIVNMPEALAEKLLEFHNMPREYDVRTQSVQTVADASNEYGTYIKQKAGNMLWVGSPLVVHRRCVNPMFDLANLIAYDGLMQQQTHVMPGPYSKIIRLSKWLDVKADFSNLPDDHWVEQEGRLAIRIMDTLINYYNECPNVYIISPFSIIPYNLLKKIRKEKLLGWSRVINTSPDSLLLQLEDQIGTIHAFQGKQASVVILLLGGNINKNRAIDWTCEKPNMLNVALTRAKHAILVIGNYKLWSTREYMNELAEYLPIERFDLSLNKIRPIPDQVH